MLQVSQVAYLNGVNVLQAIQEHQPHLLHDFPQNCLNERFQELCNKLIPLQIEEIRMAVPKSVHDALCAINQDEDSVIQDMDGARNYTLFAWMAIHKLYTTPVVTIEESERMLITVENLKRDYVMEIDFITGDSSPRMICVIERKNEVIQIRHRGICVTHIAVNELLFDNKTELIVTLSDMLCHQTDDTSRFEVLIVDEYHHSERASSFVWKAGFLELSVKRNMPKLDAGVKDEREDDAIAEDDPDSEEIKSDTLSSFDDTEDGDAVK